MINFLTLRYLMISKIQKSWRQSCDIAITGSFQTGLETTICRRSQGPSQLSTPLTPNSFFASSCHERPGWGRQNWVWSRARQTLGTPLRLSGNVVWASAKPFNALYGFGTPSSFGCKIFSGLGFSAGDVTNVGVFEFFAYLSGPGRQLNKPLLAHVFLENRLKSASFELLVGFLAYLEPKVWRVYFVQS